MLDLVVVDGQYRQRHHCGATCARRARFPSRHNTTPWCWATGGYGNVFYLSTNARMQHHGDLAPAKRAPASAIRRGHTQIHPTCIPRSDDFQSKLTLMSESLRNDGRVWVLERR